MDIKDLNKSQLLLLAVLLSFITSIVTGITTVTLMQQAPPSVTTPINRVVRQTIERIEQVEGKTTVQTVVVKEEDLVVDAIAKNKGAVFTLTRDSNEGEISLGLGFVVNAEGVLVADAGLVGERGTYYVQNSSGKFKASHMFSDPGGFAFLKIGAPIEEGGKLVVSVPAFGDVSKVRVGQKLIVLGSTISSFIFDGDKDIRVNVTKSSAGSMVFNLDAEVLGIILFNDVTPFASIEAINAALTTHS